ncbi:MULTISPECIES: (2Fe-2S)-binding protein [Alcaligenaceae]|jgi:carbon-monoxide dehydrogenase small subunit/2-furoyl-CoA dehydrogenase 2Fe-2S iron sulfur subunit|uniref:(2Fe-2S)-binding protein n=1 Tax=Neopusillimonas maritima TaxID=2026239 RepID=A0A3A1YYC3_9BURK|nr:MULTISPECIES: 2Fe-2S iron-sulfur cluster-binding protein [Alcaligenaceae]MBF23834.1 (2Fe-2S)-binding protein [Pusillimonas sp.]QIM48188.1 2Fe-2S iron-sulfur cluster binding domain-containing protein [Pusillimonas sp. DMV24BSW_D]RII83522.1 (2Fe-2S)-binding protein [Neopusillimonas maritima]RIY41484.1 (2Fe-2S)-binding protein [Neopusillimonas maritima]|tara:strand:- start:47 stop:541 length:495 start_codon:yes stop_codon:yes gene_type:complete
MVQESNVVEIQVRLNDTEIVEPAPVRMHAADFLRQRCGATGVHIGCEQGVCGMCTIMVNGEAVKSCLMLAVQLDECEVQTVESLAQGDELNEVQRAFRENHGLQCGFCTPGFLMLATHLKQSGRRFSMAQLRDEVSGVMCRCTGYEGPVRAIAQYLGEQMVGEE